MRTLEELKVFKMSQLRSIAKELEITGRWELTKLELIEGIMAHEYLNEHAKERQEEKDIEIKEYLGEVMKSDNEDVKRPKTDYVNNIEVGTLVAFKINEHKVISGKIEEINDGEFLVKTKNGIRFKVWRKNIIWVKTGARWPKGVYLALRGEADVNEHKRPDKEDLCGSETNSIIKEGN